MAKTQLFVQACGMTGRSNVEKTSIRCLRISWHQKLTNGQGKTQKIGLVSQMRMGLLPMGVGKSAAKALPGGISTMNSTILALVLTQSLCYISHLIESFPCFCLLFKFLRNKFKKDVFLSEAKFPQIHSKLDLFPKHHQLLSSLTNTTVSLMYLAQTRPLLFK
ncbi:uncharacterized protein LOC131324134 [Rhododendron vialii]|uniref:uncharacterized protein LOC131324134 n=1 Tax=Rhododendron vialii TaxID=182163 RepID=UPI00265E24FA|nr:uncharacterized protein LOC131324134 [Rhododendron vialii]